VLSGSFFVDKTGGGGGGGMGRWVLVGVFDAGNWPKINFRSKLKYHLIIINMLTRLDV